MPTKMMGILVVSSGMGILVILSMFWCKKLNQFQLANWVEHSNSLTYIQYILICMYIRTIG